MAKIAIEGRKKWKSFLNDSNGVAAIEFALIAPVLLILLIGVTNFGFKLFEQARLNQVTREVAEAAQFTQNLTLLAQLLEEEITYLGVPLSGSAYMGSIILVCQCGEIEQQGCTISQAKMCNATNLPWAIAIDIKAEMEYRPLMSLLGEEELLTSKIRVQTR